MKNLCLLMAVMVWVAAEYSVEKTFTGFYNQPRNINFETVVPKPMVVNNTTQLAKFISRIVKNEISKTSPAKPSGDPFLQKPNFNFSEYMLLVMFGEDPMQGNPVVKNITVVENKMTVVYNAKSGFEIASYPQGVARYTAVMVKNFAGEIVFEEETSTTKANKTQRKKFSFDYVTTRQVRCSENPPQSAQVSRVFNVEARSTFDVVKDMGSYLHVEFYNGKSGYVVNDAKNWHKLSTVYGKVAEFKMNKGGAVFASYMLHTDGEKEALVKKGYFFHPPTDSINNQLKKMMGSRVKIRAYIQKIEGDYGGLRIYDIVPVVSSPEIPKKN